ncbi:hypothetical protein HAX54_032094, partial [Datura stramonium]|nr:hypothetical protein [Datura stramonium]
MAGKKDQGRPRKSPLLVDKVVQVIGPRSKQKAGKVGKSESQNRSIEVDLLEHVLNQAQQTPPATKKQPNTVPLPEK